MGVFMITGIFILVMAIVLIINTMQRSNEFKNHQGEIQKTVVHGAGYAINLQLQNKRRHVRLFIEEYASQLKHLVRFSNDEKTKNDLENRLKQRFPDFLAYTITTQNGNSIFQDIDSLVGDACKVDLARFAKKPANISKPVLNKVFIHPQPFQYHYDIMAHLPFSNEMNSGKHQVFFSSFYLQEIADILKTHGVPGQNLMLVRQSDPALIEVTQQGARDTLSREIRLSDEEQRRIKFYLNIPDSDWQIVNLPDVDFAEDYQRALWKDAIILLLIVSLALVILTIVMIKLLGKKELQ